VLLGVPVNATREEVRAAFRRQAFALHPDVSDLPKDEAEARFKVLNEAYAYIKLSNRWV
jgi:curved DNA-binding protein CbpA